MARKKREPFTIESNLEKIIAKVEDKPQRVMNTIGLTLAREIRATTLKSMYTTRTKILSRALGYWARKREKDLQIGFKASITKNPYGAGPGLVGDMITGHIDPIKPVVAKNIPYMQELIGKALAEIETDKR